MATFAYLLLDDQYDPVFDPTAQLVDGEAVAQAILTNLKLFTGEWWENTNFGLPVFQSMLGQLGTQQTQNAMELAIQRQIENTVYVISVTNISVSFRNGQFSFTATAQTVFGAVTVSNTPGDSASLGLS